jgi:hypothetical protein
LKGGEKKWRAVPLFSKGTQVDDPFYANRVLKKYLAQNHLGFASTLSTAMG